VDGPVALLTAPISSPAGSGRRLAGGHRCTGNLPFMAEGTSTGVSQALGERAAALLGELIAIDTRNPPGGELAAQQLLAGELSDAGFECELLAAEEGRPNLVARLRGEREGPALCLLGHTDVVPFDADAWSFDPLSGAVRDGEVLGRGAQDMKGQVAAEVAAAVELGSSGWRPERGELLVVATVDEEMGGRAGARWLCERHPEKVRCEWVVNEGGGFCIEAGGRRSYTLCVAEKGVFRFYLRTRGRAGHASLPMIGDNALTKLGPYLERLTTQPEPDPDRDAVRFLEVMLDESLDGPESVPEALGRLAGADPVAAACAAPMLGVSISPTRIRASDKDNVIPALAEVLVDCRVPPGMEEGDVRRAIVETIGEGDYELDFAERVVGNRSEPDGPLADAIGSWLAARDPGAVLAPMVMPGFSDSHWFRKELGAVAYGFFPQRAMLLADAIPLIHGADERIRVDDLALAADFFAELPRRLLHE
jgi:acetylornithine deacetylase/succinyl-diaminopimelate desuccinylase-like protein